MEGGPAPPSMSHGGVYSAAGSNEVSIALARYAPRRLPQHATDIFLANARARSIASAAARRAVLRFVAYAS